MKNIVVASLFAASALASQGAFALSTVNITWQGTDTAGLRMDAMDTNVSATVPVLSNYATTALNYKYTSTGESFVAFCIEPTEGNGRAINRHYDYVVDSFAPVQAKGLQGLYSTSYASVMSSGDQSYKAAFQLAVWELVLETSGTMNVNSGSFQLKTVNATVSTLANSFLSQAAAYTGPAHYSLAKLTNTGVNGNPGLQDLIVATPLAAVPEPESYAMLLAGLGIVAFVARRRPLR